VHHNFARSLDLLEGVQSDVVQVAGAVKISLLVPHDLLKEVVSSSFSLLPLQKEVVGGSDLVVFVVLDVGDCLVQVTVWTDPRGRKAVLDLAQELFDHRHSVFANHDTLHFSGLHLSVPLVGANVSHHESLLRVSVQHLPDQVLGRLGDDAWDQVVAVQNLLVELACIGVFEGEIPASHGVEDDTTAPNIRVKAMVLLTGDHLRSSIARTSTSGLKGLSLLVHVRKTKINNLDVVLVIEEQVLGFQISVADFDPMNIFNS